MSELQTKEWDGKPADKSSEDFLHPAPTQTDSKGSLFGYTLLALALALFIRFFVAAPYVVSGASMEPNFHNWDYLITDRVSYRMSEPARGDVIVFHLPQEYSRTLIKRVIGLPGETVVVEGTTVRVSDGENTMILDESYLSEMNLGGPTNVSVSLGQDEYFVMGDNRRVSSDSRTWGALPRDHIVGRVLLRLFPFTSLGFLPAEARYLEE